MSEEKKVSTRVLTPASAEPQKPAEVRFFPLEEKFNGYPLQIRKWEIYQARAIKHGLNTRFGVQSLEEIEEVKDYEQLAKWLQTCLVDYRVKSAPQLAFKGTEGHSKLMNEFENAKIKALFIQACEVSKLYE